MSPASPESSEPTAESFRRERPLEDWRQLWHEDRSFPLPVHPGWIGRLKLRLKRWLRRVVGGAQVDLWERQRLFNLRLLSEAAALRRRDAETAAGFGPLDQRLFALGQDLQTIQKELVRDLAKAQEESNRQLVEAKESLLVYIQKNLDFLHDHDERILRQETFLKDGIEEVNRHTDALFARVDQRLDVYRRESYRLWAELRALLAAVEEGGGGAIAGASADLDYVDLERIFRGREADIGGRLEPYLEILDGRGEVLDLGCGRGEALELLAARGIPCRGVDGNREMVAACRRKGLSVERGDLFAALEAAAGDGLGAVVSFHVIEHLPGGEIERLVRLAWRALAPGGVLVLETPNPLSLVVAARNFWLDPTHLRPVHPETLHLTFERAGFDPVERIDLQPFAADQRLPEISLDGLPEPLAGLAADVNRLRDDLDRLLFGYQDYGMVGYKPGGDAAGSG